MKKDNLINNTNEELEEDYWIEEDDLTDKELRDEMLQIETMEALDKFNKNEKELQKFMKEQEEERDRLKKEALYPKRKGAFDFSPVSNMGDKNFAERLGYNAEDKKNPKRKDITTYIDEKIQDPVKRNRFYFGFMIVCLGIIFVHHMLQILL